MEALQLTQFGLTEEEAQVYLTVLELGGAYASTIASQAKIPRVNCYYTLEKLVKKGFVSMNYKGKVKFFAAEPPQVLVNKMEDQYKNAKRLLPELLSVTNVHAFKPIIRSYEGLSGIKKVFDQALQSKSEIVGYTNLEALGELIPDYLPSYNQKLVENKIKTRWLSPSTKSSREFTKQFFPKDFPKELVEILFVNPKEFAFENQIAIFDNIVTIVSLNPDELIALSIESAVYARTQKAIFNLSWLGATAFVAQ